MRIALAGPSWPFRGGIACHTTHLAQKLHERNTLAGFFVPYRQYPGFAFPGKSDRDENACSKLPYAQPSYAFCEPWTWRTLRQQILKTKPDVLIVPYWTLLGGPLLLYLSKSNVPILTLFHNFYGHEKSWFERPLLQSLTRHSSGFFLHSKGMARGFPSSKPTHVHPLPLSVVHKVDSEQARKRLGIPLEKTVLLYFGIIRRYKGLEVLLEAMKQVENTNTLLLIVGEAWDPTRDKIQNYVSTAGLQHRVKLSLQWMSEEDVPFWFSAADGVVLPYLSSYGSAVASQALAYGKPVIASRVEGLVDVIEHGRNGLLFPPKDSQQLARAVDLFCNGDLRKTLTEGTASSTVLNWEAYVESVERLADRVLRREPHRNAACPALTSPF